MYRDEEKAEVLKFLEQEWIEDNSLVCHSFSELDFTDTDDEDNIASKDKFGIQWDQSSPGNSASHYSDHRMSSLKFSQGSTKNIFFSSNLNFV